MSDILTIHTPRLYQPAPPTRDPTYRAFVRSFLCVVCKSRRGIEAAHTGPHGISQKASDRSCVALCHQEHRELHQIGPARFQDEHVIDFASLTVQYQELWNEQQARKAA